MKSNFFASSFFTVSLFTDSVTVSFLKWSDVHHVWLISSMYYGHVCHVHACVLCVMSPMSVLVSVALTCHVCACICHGWIWLLCSQTAPLKGHRAMIQECEHIQKLITISWISPPCTLKIHSTCMKSIQG